MKPCLVAVCSVVAGPFIKVALVVWGVCVGSLFYKVGISILSSLTIYSLRKRDRERERVLLCFICVLLLCECLCSAPSSLCRRWHVACDCGVSLSDSLVFPH